MKQRTEKNPCRREQHRALDEIFQLANIAGPGIACESFHGLSRHVGDGFVKAAAELLDEISDEQRNVFRALAESGNVNGKNVEAIVKIAGESTTRYEVREV